MPSTAAMGTLASAAARATAKASRFSTAAPLARDRRRASDVVRVIASGVAAAPRQAPAGVAACSAATSAGAAVARWTVGAGRYPSPRTAAVDSSTSWPGTATAPIGSARAAPAPG